MVELQVHLRQRLLHVLDMRGGIVQQALALAQVSPQSGDFTPELETGTQQAILVQAAKPLGIAHIGLASRDMLGVTGVDEHHLEPALLKNLDRRGPSKRPWIPWPPSSPRTARTNRRAGEGHP